MSRGAQKRKKKKKLKGIVLIAASVTIVLILGIVLLSAQRQNVPLDPASLCPKDQPPAATWLVLLDLTEAYNATQQTAIKRNLEQLRRELPRHGQLQFYLVGGPSSRDNTAPILTLCNPGTPDSANPLIENPDRIRAFWEDKYTKPIETMVDTIIGDAESDRSPIMETVQLASVSGLPIDSENIRLVLISDLLQNTSLYTQYQPQPPSFRDFESSDVYQRLRTDLHRTEVIIWYIRRHVESANRVQGRSHVAFWEAFFRDQGATITEIKRIPG